MRLRVPLEKAANIHDYGLLCSFRGRVRYADKFRSRGAHVHGQLAPRRLASSAAYVPQCTPDLTFGARSPQNICSALVVAGARFHLARERFASASAPSARAPSLATSHKPFGDFVLSC